MRLARKIVMYLLFVGMLMTVYDSFENYRMNGDDFARDPKVLYEIYEELPVPSETEEAEKEENIRKRSSLSLNVYYHTEWPIEEIMQFYESRLTSDGWQMVEKQKDNVVTFKKEKWKISVIEEKDEYRVHIYKFYTH